MGDNETNGDDSIPPTNDNGEDEDFLVRSLQMGSNDNVVECHQRQTPPKSLYNSKKPKWWRQQSRRPSKKLKQAIYAMQDEYCMTRPPYGEILDWKSVFSSSGGTTTTRKQEVVSQQEPQVWIEIGFGLGDNLLCLANHFPNRCYLGSEVHAGGVGSILQKIQKSLQNGTPWTEYSLFVDKNNDGSNNGPAMSNAKQQVSELADDSVSRVDTEQFVVPTPAATYDHVRIYRQDITKLLPYIPDHTVHSILVTFPDPFPYGEEWRLLQVDVLYELHRILVVNGGGRIYLATDHPGHFEWCRSQVQHFNDNKNSSSSLTLTKTFALVEPTPDRASWLPVVSKYEQKGWDEGRGTLLACWSASTTQKTILLEEG